MPSSVEIAGRRRSYVTLPGYRLGMKPANAGLTYPAEVYTRDEIEQLLAALGRGNSGARDRAAVVLMWRCGLRIAEVLALYPHDVDLANRIVIVRRGKGNKRRMLGIDPQAAAVVELWMVRRQELGLTSRQPLICVFSGATKGKAMHDSCLREKIKDAGARAGVGGGRGAGAWGKRVSPHCLRHTFASELAREGVSLPLIMALLGHSDLRVTSRYIHGLSPWEAIDAARARTWAPLAHQPVVAAQQPDEVAQRLGAAAVGRGVALPRLTAEHAGGPDVGLEGVVDLADEPGGGVAGAPSLAV